jgi:hypothetical protein
MKLNHMICPNCSHDFYVEAAYGTCDSCQCCFYASQSATVRENRYHAPIFISTTRLVFGGESSNA